MNETVDQENPATQEEREERTFTQSEMDAIIRDRLARERGKYADYDAVKAKAEQFDAAQEADRSELQRALERATELQTQVDAMNRANAVRAVRDKVSAATGVPAGLLSGESEEDCTAQAQAILEFARPGYPSVRDGGERRRPPPGAAGRRRHGRVPAAEPQTGSVTNEREVIFYGTSQSGALVPAGGRQAAQRTGDPGQSDLQQPL